MPPAYCKVIVARFLLFTAICRYSDSFEFFSRLELVPLRNCGVLKVAQRVVLLVHLAEHFDLLFIHAYQFCVIDLECHDGLLPLQTQLILLEILVEVFCLCQRACGANNSLGGLCPL